MKIVTFEEIRRRFRDYNKKHNVDYGASKPTLRAVIVYKQENFNKPYTVEERSYEINNVCGKAFFNMPSGSRSIVGNSLDGSDMGVRLDFYDWDIDYCYYLDDDGDALGGQMTLEEVIGEEYYANADEGADV